MNAIKDSWWRSEHAATPLYLSRSGPTWFVPDAAGDALLQALAEHPQRAVSIEEQRFLQRLPDTQFAPYMGRSAKAAEPQLRELWFHLTNRCNMACRHCLFASGPAASAELDAAYVLRTAAQASAMGCSVFALTGGEPFIHEHIAAIVQGLLALPRAHVVVLTNAVALAAYVPLIKSWERGRFHLQISLDGMESNHEAIRGKGSFGVLAGNLRLLKDNGIAFTLSMAVSRQNVDDMADVVAYAATVGATSVHFMWHFVRGRGTQEDFVAPQELFRYVTNAVAVAEQCGVVIDNITTLKTQIFSASGTIHDGSGAGRESAAIGPDKKLYPSAATVGIEALATDVNASLQEAWLHSPVLQGIRAVSIATSTEPWRFYTGGGDFDHSYMHKGCSSGADPYHELYSALFGWLIAKEANGIGVVPKLSLKLACGEILEQCETEGAIVATHSNCLLSVSGDSHLSVRSFYSDAATTDNDDIVNPICYPEDEIAHIPSRYRFRGYGCGSPVIDAAIKAGEHVVDLGSGRGIECFIAAKKAGPMGQVTGVDMLDPMLDIARAGAQEVSAALGYNNLRFVKGYLESLPLESDSVDVVLSNCVLNLSPHKRKTFAELYRILREGGRIVISDVVCEQEPHGGIRSSSLLKGECIAGALRQQDLSGLLRESGFGEFSVVKRFPYRIVEGKQFYSMTFSARKVGSSPMVQCLYRGPGSSIVAPDGTLLFAGVTTSLSQSSADALGESLLVFDETGAVTNIAMTSSCSCALPSVAGAAPRPENKAAHPTVYRSGCMICAQPLVYLSGSKMQTCYYCNQEHSVNAVCSSGHYVCDTCHAADALEVIRRVCRESSETDMLKLLSAMRSHPSFPLHGPEHHAMVPAIILTAYNNSGGTLPRQLVATAIERGMLIAGGSCAFSGVCGAAAGVGVAFSLILDANPYKATPRMQVQSAVSEVMQRLSSMDAARCCRRDCMLALQCAAAISQRYLGIVLEAKALLACDQQVENKECQGSGCPFFDV
jgi:MoaA/NifB/PqqE/SkfB family radical SAM enzyme/SAM-dependent methyltransferase